MSTGKISKAEYETLRATIAEQFRVQIEALIGPKPGLSKIRAADIIAGHDDGMRNLIMALRCKGTVKVTD